MDFLQFSIMYEYSDKSNQFNTCNQPKKIKRGFFKKAIQWLKIKSGFLYQRTEENKKRDDLQYSDLLKKPDFRMNKSQKSA